MLLWIDSWVTGKLGLISDYAWAFKMLMQFQGLIVLRIRSHLIVQPKHEFRAAEFQLRVDPRLRSPDGIDAATILVSTINHK